VPRTSTFKSGPVPVEDAGTFQLHRFTPDAGVKLYSAGVSNLDGSVPANLYIQLVDHTTGGTLYSNSIDFEEGTPLNTFNVPGDDVEARISNQSGTLVDCHGFMDLEVTALAATVPVTDSGVGSELFFGQSLAKKEDIGTGIGSFYGEASLKKPDSGAGVDTLSDLSAAVKKTDLGAGAETLSYREIGMLDTGSGVEELTELVNAVTDLANGVDTLSELVAVVRKMDPGSGLEAVDLTASVEGLDTGAGTGALTGLEALVEKTEVGAGVEELTELAVLVRETDTGSGVEKVFAPIRVVRDTATGENYVLTVEVPKHALKSQDYYEELVKLLEILNMKM